VLGADVPVYNLPGVSGEIKFTGAVLADIYPRQDHEVERRGTGESSIRRTKLPATDITVVHRSDGSGPPTSSWTSWRRHRRMEEAGRRGHVGDVADRRRRQGQRGVAGLVQQVPGSIGYVELIYALQNKIAYGSVQNLAGEFVRATVASVTAAAAGAAAKMPADFRVSITNAEGKGVYPISSFTWLLLYENPKDKAQSKAMVDFVKWALSDGQKFAPELGYAPLPAEVVKMELAALAKVRVS
jgi:phosphate transport system substrate-binding protein